MFPNIVGRPKDRKVTNLEYKDEFIGDEAQEKEESLNIIHVAHGSIIQDWHGLQAVLDHTFFNVLEVSPDQLAGILITEPPNNPPENVHKMVDLLFGTFSAQNVYLAF